MWVKQAWAIVPYYFEKWRESGLLWRIIGLHTAMLATTVLMIWPPPQKMILTKPVSTAKWYAVIQFLLLTYVAIIAAADALPWQDDTLFEAKPRHWVTHGKMTTAQVTFGKMISIWVLTAILLSAALPINILATYSFSFSLEAWVVPLMLIAADVTCAAIVGVGIVVLHDQKNVRFITSNVLFLLVLFVTLLGDVSHMNGFIASFHPLRVISHVTAPGAHSESFRHFWTKGIVFHVALILAALVVVQIIFRRIVSRNEKRTVTS